jgi:hypothetical protein
MPAPTYTLAGRFTGIVLTPSGKPDGGAYVTVTAYGGGPTPVPLYLGPDMASQGPNPVKADLRGNFSIWAYPGDYVFAANNSTWVDTVRSNPQDPSVIGPPGPPGPQGPAGDLGVVTFTAPAAVDMSGHRIVGPQGNGSVIYASADQLVAALSSLWLTLGAASAGDPVTLLAFGSAVEPSWNWTVDQPIFLGLNGVLTQTTPAKPPDLFLVRVANAVTPTSLFYDPQLPIEL